MATTTLNATLCGSLVLLALTGCAPLTAVNMYTTAKARAEGRIPPQSVLRECTWGRPVPMAEADRREADACLEAHGWRRTGFNPWDGDVYERAAGSR